ncbi:MAG: DEAD/DEAH box helicase [Lewinellaceae bacterium]|nr:DEAD/DEAH box helicase [Lewinellaceae bacterium]
MLFKEMPLIEPLLKALETEGYVNPTPIQEQSIPIILERRDLLGCAQTGTGKTAAFALPMLQLLYEDKRNAGANNSQGNHHRNDRAPQPIKALILTPTRELAIQISESFTAYGRNAGLRNLVVFGGVSQHAQTEALRRGTDILVATPGRLLDLMNQGFISLRDISIFVLDEADRMLDMGFIHDVKKVIAKLPAKRQTLFFSATMPPEIAGLADSILTDPAKVAVTPVASTAEKVTQAIYFVDKKDKKNLLIHLLKNKDISSALIFTRTKHGANRVAGDLTKAGISAEAIHGNKSQNARQAALGNFKKGRIRVLVATDIAARGIDIEELSHVINFELPNIPETYVHRIGRTGRAGASGIAWSFCEAEEIPYLKDIQKLTGQLVPVVTDHPYAADLQAPAIPQPRQPKPAANGKKPQQPGRNNPEREAGNNRPPQREGVIPLPERKPDNRQQHTPAQRPATPQRPAEQQKPAQQQRPQEQQKPAHARPPQHKPASQERPVQNPAQKSNDSGLGFGGKRRFASILEVSTIEKQAFSRRDRADSKFPPKRSESSADGKKDETPKSEGFGGKKNNSRRWRGNGDKGRR